MVTAAAGGLLSGAPFPSREPESAPATAVSAGEVGVIIRRPPTSQRVPSTRKAPPAATTQRGRKRAGGGTSTGSSRFHGPEATRSRTAGGGGCRASRATTLKLTDALTPSQVALSITSPGCRVITQPPAVTTATLTSLVLQLTTRSVREPAHRSSGVAVKAKESPAVTNSGGGEMWSATTGAGMTVTVTLARASSSSAEIRVDPPDRATSRPSRLMVATESFSDFQVTGRETTRPRLSRGIASSRTSSPTEIAFSGGFTVIASARGGATVTRSRP